MNADVYVNANGDLMGYNMYAYCSNNPTAEMDPSGYQTISIGINFLGTLIGGASYTYNLSFDFHGNIGIQRTEANIFKKQSGGIFGIADLAMNIVAGTSDLDTIYDLEKESYSADVSFGKNGVELVSTDINDLTGSFHGVNATLFGLSAIPSPVNGHVTVGITETIASLNIADAFKSVWKEVKSWFS